MAMRKSALFILLLIAACKGQGAGKADLPPATGPGAPPPPALPQVQPIAPASADPAAGGDARATGTLFAQIGRAHV